MVGRVVLPVSRLQARQVPTVVSHSGGSPLVTHPCRQEVPTMESHDVGGPESRAHSCITTTPAASLSPYRPARLHAAPAAAVIFALTPPLPPYMMQLEPSTISARVTRIHGNALEGQWPLNRPPLLSQTHATPIASFRTEAPRYIDLYTMHAPCERAS